MWFETIFANTSGKQCSFLKLINARYINAWYILGNIRIVNSCHIWLSRLTGTQVYIWDEITTPLQAMLVCSKYLIYIYISGICVPGNESNWYHPRVRYSIAGALELRFCCSKPSTLFEPGWSKWCVIIWSHFLWCAIYDINVFYYTLALATPLNVGIKLKGVTH